MKYLSIHFSGRYSRLLHRDNSSIIEFFPIDPPASLYLKIWEAIPGLLLETSLHLDWKSTISKSGVLNCIEFICRSKYIFFPFKDYRVSINLNLIFVKAAEICLQSISFSLWWNTVSCFWYSRSRNQNSLNIAISEYGPQNRLHNASSINTIAVIKCKATRAVSGSINEKAHFPVRCKYKPLVKLNYYRKDFCIWDFCSALIFRGGDGGRGYSSSEF